MSVSVCVLRGTGVRVVIFGILVLRVGSFFDGCVAALVTGGDSNRCTGRFTRVNIENLSRSLLCGGGVRCSWRVTRWKMVKGYFTNSYRDATIGADNYSGIYSRSIPALSRQKRGLYRRCQYHSLAKHFNFVHTYMVTQNQTATDTTDTLSLKETQTVRSLSHF